MDNFLKHQLYTWIYQTIQNSPQIFGGDNSNALITYEYVKEFHYHNGSFQLSPYVMSIISTVSRQKNKLLKEYPEYDFRRKYKPKKDKLSATKKTLLEL